MSDIKQRMEDHALESVPQEARHGWLRLSWNTAGIGTTLIIMFFGALGSFAAGLKIAMIAGLFVATVGSALAWASSHIAFKTGLSSTVMARRHGFGKLGSLLGSLIFGSLVIGFLALENVLLYVGFRFAFNMPDTLTSQIIIYGILTIAWIFFTAYGFGVVSKVSSFTLVTFIALLVFITWRVVAADQTGQVFSFQALFPPEALSAMGAADDFGKFLFCINLFIAGAFGLSMIGADLGRFARSSTAVGVAVIVGNLAMTVVMVFVGAIFMYAAMGKLIEHYTTVMHMTTDAAQKLAMSPDGVTAGFLLFGGWIGVVLMILAQGKAQVLNTYSGSLALSNFFDALGIRTRRVIMVVFANVIALLLIAFGILDWVQTWIEVLGVMITAFVSVMIADYYFVTPRLRSSDEDEPELINWAGVITTIAATALAHNVLIKVMPIQIITSLLSGFVLYPLLRLTIFRPKAPADTDQPA
ncbi:MAG: purine-cytosine permease-like transporter [Burkholderiaceae bacterium]|jgi:cytosine permease|nr:purine-cytosine permease-like transporter [Burkholderiaceae bacterium]